MIRNRSGDPVWERLTRHASGPRATSTHFLQVLSLTLFEKMPIFKLFSDTDYSLSNVENSNQLILFE